MNRIVFCFLLMVVPLASNAQSRKFVDYVDYDMTLFLERDRKLVSDAMLKYIRPDAITYYPWLYGPAYTMRPNANPLSPTYCFGRDSDRYYFVISLKETAEFPNADIESSPFLNILCSDSSVLTLRLDSVTPLIESLWYFIEGTWTHDRGKAVVNDEAFEYPFSSGLADGYTLAEYHLDIVFDIDDIDAFMSKHPVMFNILGGQYVLDFTDNPKFIRRFAKGMRQSRKKLDKVYDLYHKGRSKLY